MTENEEGLVLPDFGFGFFSVCCRFALSIDQSAPNNCSMLQLVLAGLSHSQMSATTLPFKYESQDLPSAFGPMSFIFGLKRLNLLQEIYHDLVAITQQTAKISSVN